MGFRDGLYSLSHSHTHFLYDIFSPVQPVKLMSPLLSHMACTVYGAAEEKMKREQCPSSSLKKNRCRQKDRGKGGKDRKRKRVEEKENFRSSFTEQLCFEKFCFC